MVSAGALADRFCGEAVGVSERLWELLTLRVGADSALALCSIHLLVLQVGREELADLGTKCDAVALGSFGVAKVSVCLLQSVDLLLHALKLRCHIIKLLICLQVAFRFSKEVGQSVPLEVSSRFRVSRDFEEWFVFSVHFLFFHA